MSAACEVNLVPIGYPGQFAGHCGEPATVTVEAGCVHEHITTELVCQRHADKLTSQDAAAACARCWEAGHQCAIIGRVKVAP
jgi:hypothetical protein